MTDKRQAIIDAIQTLIDSRQNNGNDFPVSGGEQTVEIDPNLTLPNGQQQVDNNENIDIDDPDGVLDKLNKNKQNKQPDNKTDNIGSQDSQSSEDSGGEETGDDLDDQSTTDGSDNGSQGSNGKDTTTTNSQHTQQQGEPGNQQQTSAKQDTDSQTTQQIDPMYADGWNAAMSKYDADTYSDDDLIRILADIETGNIISL